MPTALSTAQPQGDTAQSQSAGLPFTLGSAFSSRQAFSVTQALGASTVAPVSFPVNVPSFGWISNIVLDIAIAYTAGATAPTLAPDGFSTVIDHIGVRTSGGNPLIQPIDGYSLKLDNKYGGKRFGASMPQGSTDPDTLPGTNLTLPAANGSATNRIFRSLQFEIDPSSGLGCIPATASNREFTIDLVLAAIGTVFPTNPPAAVTVTIVATAFYWDVPADLAMPFGADQQSQTLRILQNERQVIPSGEAKVKTSNVGNVIMNHYIVMRTSAGVRDDSDFSDPFQIDIDNNARLWWTKNQWKLAMANWFGLTAAIDTPGGLDSGVYVLPWRLLAGGAGADQNASHAQYLATLDTTLFQLHPLATGAGGAGGSLQLLTDAVSTPDAAYVYSK